MSKQPFSWANFRDLPKGGEPDYLIDTARINRRLAGRNQNPYREHICAFPMPKQISSRAFKARAKGAIETFLGTMEKSGWTLEGKLRYERREVATDPDGKVLPECFEYRVTGLFKTRPKPWRIEVPAGLVKQDPEHRITLREAIRAG